MSHEAAIREYLTEEFERRIEEAALRFAEFFILTHHSTPSCRMRGRVFARHWLK